MVKRTDGVKSGQGCEGVTVGALRAVAPAARTVANLVPVGSSCSLGVSCALQRSPHICKASIPGVQQSTR
eukprot:3766341-Prymnesium_polylepis.2